MTQQLRDRVSAPSMFYLKDWRVHAGLSQEALAHQAGVSLSTISRAERHQTWRPKPSVVHKVAQALDLDPSSLDTPPPGTPDLKMRILRDVVFGIDCVAAAAEDGQMFDAIRVGNEENELALAKWILAESVDARGLPLGLPDPEELRDAASFLERLADAVATVEDQSRED
jgi:transcriptional regulator with XRE-family HTH domain